MAILMAKASGNLTAATTWALVDPTSYMVSEAGTAIPPGTSGTTSRSATFTPGAITIDAIAVRPALRATATGNIIVSLYNATTSGTVTGSQVTVIAGDLPTTASVTDTGWVLFKFAAPITLLAANAYAIDVVTSTSNFTLARSGTTTSDWTRALRTTTEQAPAAGDDMIIASELTGAGTRNEIVVTMDSTALTQYGSIPTVANALLTPGIAICNGGTLRYGTAAATNYTLRLANNLIVYRNSKFYIGEVGTPIPRDSTASLEFAVLATSAAKPTAADGDYGLYSRNNATVTMQGLSRTLGKNAVFARLTANLAASGVAPSTSTLNLDTDTGWLAGDLIAIAPTSRTNTEAEAATLTANAGANSLTANNFTVAAAGQSYPLSSNRGALYAHAGIAVQGTGINYVPQAEVILLTRNVRVRSTAPTMMTFVFFDNTTIVNLDWVEFCYLGINAASKRGVEVNTTTGSCNIHYCSFHDFESGGFYANHSALNNIDFGYNVLWNMATSVSATGNINVASATTGTNIVFDNNIIIKNSVGVGFYSADIGITVTNLTVAGVTSAGIQITEATAAFAGYFANLVTHSGNGAGINLSGPIDITNLVVYRNNSAGIDSVGNESLIDGGTAFGNSVAGGRNSTTSSLGTKFKNFFFNGDTSFAQPWAWIIQGSSGVVDIIFDNCEFSTVSGIKTAHSVGGIGHGPLLVEIVMINAATGVANEIAPYVAGQPMLPGSYISSQKHDRVAGNHITWMRSGKVQTDNIIKYSPAGRTTPWRSARMTPIGTATFTANVAVNSNVLSTVSTLNNIPLGAMISGTGIPVGTTIVSMDRSASSIVMSNNATATGTGVTITWREKLESAPPRKGMLIPITAGNSAYVSTFVRKSVAGDGTAYNGNQPRLICRANAALGLLTDTVLDIGTSAAGVWEELAGTTPAAVGDDGYFEIIVDCDGTAGWINFSN